MSLYDFRDIGAAPKDGRSLILADDTGWQAAGHWNGGDDGFWALGHKDQPGVIEQLDFEPTRFAKPTKTQPPHTVGKED